MRPILSVALFAIIFSTACRKDQPGQIIDPPPPPPPLTEYIPIYHSCDTGAGKAFALKSTKRWQAGASCRKIKVSGKDYWVIEIRTCSEEGFLRESLGLSGIPDSNPVQKYIIKNFTNTIIPGAADPTYAKVSQDGDVLEDYYLPDTTLAGSFVQIDIWDNTNKKVEGRFSVAFDILEPRYNPINPKRVHFTSGRFWLKLP